MQATETKSNGRIKPRIMRDMEKTKSIVSPYLVEEEIIHPIEVSSNITDLRVFFVDSSSNNSGTAPPGKESDNFNGNWFVGGNISAPFPYFSIIDNDVDAPTRMAGT
jgi:hypothetical protein